MIFTSRASCKRESAGMMIFDTYTNHRKEIWEKGESETERAGEKEEGVW
jgi:hypothetical protein